MKAKINLLLLFVTSCLCASSVKGEIGIGEIWGTAWSIGNIIVGTTTITPAYKVSYWDYRVKLQGTNQFTSANTFDHWLVTCDPILGTYYYHYSGSGTMGYGIPHNTNSEAAFPLNFIGRWNYQREVALKIGPGTGTYVLDYKTKVWLASVARTGLWPDRGPWDVWLKTSGNHFYCDWKAHQIVNGPPIFFRGSASLSEYGSQTITIGSTTCLLDYPFALTGDPYF